MANVTVFVDDAVLGTVPRICVIDGVPTTDRLTVTEPIRRNNGLGLAWLLILAGPLGWLILLLIARVQQSGETLTVTLPYCEDAYRRRIQAERARLRATLVAVLSFVGGFIAAIQQTTDLRLLAAALVAVGCIGLAEFVVQARRLDKLSVRLDLNASRRWLTLRGVSQEFVESMQFRGREAPSHSFL